jgi:predicted phage-related endonuclease
MPMLDIGFQAIKTSEYLKARLTRLENTTFLCLHCCNQKAYMIKEILFDEVPKEYLLQVNKSINIRFANGKKYQRMIFDANIIN